MRSLVPLRSLTIKFGIVLFGLVFLSLGVLEFVVVPRLESRLVEARIDRLERAVPAFEKTLPTLSPSELRAGEELPRLAGRYETRATVLSPLTSDSLIVFADSAVVLLQPGVTNDPVALGALRTTSMHRGRVERGGRSYAEVAFPVEGSIVLLSAPLSDVLQSFDLMRRSLLVAGALALLVAAVVAYAVAWGLTRRMRGLETAAERIAGGDFSQPVVDRGRDEVAQLATAFENMRERLAHLERARREFIQNASHELRTPLFSLGGFLELLADEDLDEATRQEFLAETREQVGRLTRLATDLLDLSRLDAGQIEVEEGDVELGEIAGTVCDEFRPAAEASGHELGSRLPGPVIARADAQRVLQIARILVQNAIRHTPAGTAVDVRTALEGTVASLEVADSGPGIPAEAIPHLFERFYRAAGGRTSGSGLGLAIASELATRMHGRLTVTSEPGATAFRLELPAGAEPFQRENGERVHDEATARA